MEPVLTVMRCQQHLQPVSARLLSFILDQNSDQTRNGSQFLSIFRCASEPGLTRMTCGRLLQILYQAVTLQPAGRESSTVIKPSPSSLWLSRHARTDVMPNGCSLRQIGSGSFPLPRTWTFHPVCLFNATVSSETFRRFLP